MYPWWGPDHGLMLPSETPLENKQLCNSELLRTFSQLDNLNHSQQLLRNPLQSDKVIYSWELLRTSLPVEKLTYGPDLLCALFLYYKSFVI